MRRTSAPTRLIAFGAAVISSLVGVLAAPAQSTPAADESLLLTLTNSVRASSGVPALALDSGLSSVARQWASSMAASGGISHNANLKNQVGSGWVKIGENVGYGGTLQAIHAALLNSPSHLRNIVDPEFQRIGIGVVWANNLVWLVQVFYTPATSVSTPASPTSAPPATSTPATAAPATAPAPVKSTPTTSTSTTTTTVAPSTTTTSVAPTSSPGLPLRLTLMVQQVRTLRLPS